MRFRLPSRVSWKLLSAILPIVVIAIGVIVSTQYTLARRQILAEIDTAIRELTDRASSNIDSLLRQRSDDLLTLADSPLIADYYHNVEYKLTDEAESYREELERYLRDFAKRSRVYHELLYLDAHGREVCAIEDGAARARKEQTRLPPSFVAARPLRRGTWWTSPIETTASGRSTLYFATPIRDELGNFKGALVAGYDLSQIRAILKATAVGTSGIAYLETESGRFPPDAKVDGLSGGVLTARSSLVERPWRLVVQASSEEFLAPLRKTRDAGILVATAGTIVLIVIILLLVRSITRPVAVLLDAARRIGHGDLTHRIGNPGNDELGALSQAFNEMARSLDSNRRINSELQSQLIQAEKLSAIGQLISSVAHELNNPLSAVCAYVQITLMENGETRLKQDLEHVYHNALRCRKVVDNLLFFVRKSRQERGRVDLNRVVASALELLEYRLVKTEDVAVEQELTRALPAVVADFQQIVQVLINLINNACDAMEQAIRYPDSKRIKLKTWSGELSVFLSVEDNGPGISPKLANKVFEPFFTTKDQGRGTGLGLSICRQIVAEHGGKISFSSEEGHGTIFTVELPLPSREELPLLEEPPKRPLRPPVPGRKILVVDDEREIAEAMARLLRNDGDEVEISTEGLEALRLIAERSYDLVISDFEMEKAKGEDLYVELARKPADSRCPILFVTGDILNPKVLRFLERTKSPYMAKPFDLGDLQQTVRRLLEP